MRGSVVASWNSSGRRTPRQLGVFSEYENLWRPNAEVLVESVLWVFRAYRNHGFSPNYWAAQLNTWFQVLPQQLSVASWAEIRPWYEWLQVNIPIFVLLTDKSKGGQ